MRTHQTNHKNTADQYSNIYPFRGINFVVVFRDNQRKQI